MLMNGNQRVCVFVMMDVDVDEPCWFFMCVDRKPSGLLEEQKGECCLEKVGHVVTPAYFSHHGPVLTCHSGHPRSCFQGSCISSCSHSAK